MREFIIQENDADQRVDKFIQKTMKTMPKSLMYKYIRNKKIKVNRKRCEISQRLQAGDSMQCFIAEEFFESVDQGDWTFLQVHGNVDVLYEDQDILIVNKAKGLLAHSDQSGVQDNLADRILHYLYEKKEYDPQKEQSFTPALCHRIDRNTQGIVIAAKNAAALRAMNEHIRNRDVVKKYLCIAQGIFTKKEDHVILYHRKEEGNRADIVDCETTGYKKMESRYRIIDQGRMYALLEVELLSGKSHQIRAMMGYLKHPLVGDVKYGAKKDSHATYQELCAYRVEFHFSDDSRLAQLNGRVVELKQVDLMKRYEKDYKNR